MTTITQPLAPTVRATRMGIFAALYAATSLIPVSVFIGAPSLLSANLIMTPAIALLLTPSEAFATALIGALIALWIFPPQAIFGPLTILLPVVGATLGSLAYHKPKFGTVITVYLVVVSLLYLTARPEFPYWIIPHILAAILALGFIFIKSLSLHVKVPIYAFMSTICEQATMLICAVYVLALPWIVFATAFPLMLYERTVGTIGGTLVVLAVYRALAKYFTPPVVKT